MSIAYDTSAAEVRDRSRAAHRALCSTIALPVCDYVLTSSPSPSELTHQRPDVRVDHSPRSPQGQRIPCMPAQLAQATMEGEVASLEAMAAEQVQAAAKLVGVLALVM